MRTCMLSIPTYVDANAVPHVHTDVHRNTPAILAHPSSVFRACESQNIEYFNSTFDSMLVPAIGSPLLIMAIEGILFFLLTLLIEVGYMVG